MGAYKGNGTGAGPSDPQNWILDDNVTSLAGPAASDSSGFVTGGADDFLTRVVTPTSDLIPHMVVDLPSTADAGSAPPAVAGMTVSPDISTASPADNTVGHDPEASKGSSPISDPPVITSGSTTDATLPGLTPASQTGIPAPTLIATTGGASQTDAGAAPNTTAANAPALLGAAPYTAAAAAPPENAAPPPSDPAYGAYAGVLVSQAGATADQGETDDPLTDGVTYTGTVYYIDSVNGNDSNTGLSPDQAWKTLAQAETKFHVSEWDTRQPNANTDPPYHQPWTSAPSGSAFLFKRGGTYTGNIDVYPIITGTQTFENNYTFGAYGNPSDPRPEIINDSQTAAVLGHIPGQQFNIRNLNLVGNSTLPAVGINVSGTDGVNIVNTEVQGFAQAGILADGADNLTIDNTMVYDNHTSYGGGLAGGGENLKVLHSSFVDNGEGQMFAHDAYLRWLTNALIEDNLFAGGSNMGLVVHGTSDGVTIRGNEFYGNNNGLQISGHGNQNGEVFNNVLIEDNIIHGNGYQPQQQGYGMLLQSITNAVVRDNLVFDNRLAAMVFADAITGDQQSVNVRIYNNLFSGLVRLNGSQTTALSLLNNIFTSQDSGSNSFAFTRDAAFPNAQLTLDHNLYFMPNKPGGKIISWDNVPSTLADIAALFGQEAHGLNADPEFVNAGSDDYALLADSPAIDMGVNIPGVTDDFSGTPRPQGASTDIGPYEFAQSPTIVSFSTDSAVADGITSDNTLTLFGTSRAGGAVDLYDGETVLGSTTADGDGLWSYLTAPLADGEHSLTVVVAGAPYSEPAPPAGDPNDGPTATLTITIDTTAPAAPVMAAPTNSGSGSNNVLTISGSAEVDSTVNIYDGAALFGTTVADGSGAWSYGSGPLANAVHSLTAIATDVAGNIGPASAPVLAGSGGNDMIQGGGGNDRLFGFDGNDALDGKAGADTMTGGQGNDTYTVDNIGDVVVEHPGEGTDKVQAKLNGYALPDNVENLALLGVVSGFGNSGSNTITGSSGDNVLAGLGGADTLDGGTGCDSASYAASPVAVNASLATGLGHGGDAEGDVFISIEALIGSAFNDTLTGGSGRDVLDGGAGADTMTGGGGDDTYVVDNAGDTIVENPSGGTDTVQSRYSNYALPDNVENLTLMGVTSGVGNAGNNRITGSSGNNVLAGLGGADTLDGGAGMDKVTYAASPGAVDVSLATGLGHGADAEGDVLISIENLIGSAFNDTLEGDGGNNMFTGGGGSDTASYAHAAGGVTVNLGLATAQNTGGAGVDTLVGFSDITGSAFADTLTGNQMANILDGGAGADTMTGGNGDDTYIVDNAGDSIVEGLGGGIDTVQSRYSSYVLPTNVENLTLMGTVTSGIGNSGNNRITGNSGNNVLVGMGGADTLDGGAGIDKVTYEASPGAVDVSLATGLGRGADAEGDVLIGIENLIGSAFNDTLEGNGGDNKFTGGGGSDMVSYAHAAAGVTVNLRIAAAQDTGGAGLDTLAGFSSITGSAFADTLSGNQLAGVLIGGAGNDTLNGGGGNDLLEGDGGSNTFAFDPSFGKDTIADFKLGQDTVQIAQSVLPQSLNLAAAIVSDSSGNALLVASSSNTITFLGVSQQDLLQHLGDIHVA